MWFRHGISAIENRVEPMFKRLKLGGSYRGYKISILAYSILKSKKI